MCLFLTLLFFGPRMGILVYWIAWPARWEVAFDTFLMPFLGFVFLPWATLTYVVVAPGGTTGWDWVWITLAGLLDVLSLFRGSVYGRSRLGQPTVTY